MDVIPALPTFVVAVVLISASPGPAMALVVRRAALDGFGRAVPTVLGLEAGLYVWALLAAGGLAALVAASEVAFVVLRVVGGGFLLYLGLKSWRAALKRRPEGQAETSLDLPAHGAQASWRAFAEGVAVMLANPKAAAFMIAFYPQFIPSDQPLFATTAVLALVQVAMEIGIYLAVAALVARVGAFFRRTAVRRRIEAVTGTVFIALGVRMAMATR